MRRRIPKYGLEIPLDRPWPTRAFSLRSERIYSPHSPKNTDFSNVPRENRLLPPPRVATLPRPRGTYTRSDRVTTTHLEIQRLRARARRRGRPRPSTAVRDYRKQPARRARLARLPRRSQRRRQRRRWHEGRAAAPAHARAKGQPPGPAQRARERPARLQLDGRARSLAERARVPHANRRRAASPVAPTASIAGGRGGVVQAHAGRGELGACGPCARAEHVVVKGGAVEAVLEGASDGAAAALGVVRPRRDGAVARVGAHDGARVDCVVRDVAW